MFGGDSDSDSESDESEFESPLRHLPKFRPRINWGGQLTQADFKERFRLYPRQAEILLDKIGPIIAPKRYTNHTLDPKQRLLVALRFFATNSPSFCVADAEHVSKATVYRMVKKVSAALNGIDNINWPSDPDLCRKIGVDFFRISRGPHGNLPGFPCCAGAIDGSLIPIETPKLNDNIWVDRHGRHSINLQAVASPDFRFLSLSTKWPGSVNDSRVFRNSALCRKFESGYRPFNNAVLIGDSIYPMKDYLIAMRNCPPLLEFYSAHARARRIVECAFGLLKNRFPCLKSGLRMKDPNKSALIIQSCVHLHNFIIETKVAAEDDNAFMPEDHEIEEMMREENERVDNMEVVENPFLNNAHAKKIHEIFLSANNLN